MKNKLLFSAITVIICLCSCTTHRYIYTASPPNNPYFAQKGESKLSAYYSGNSDDQSASERFAGGLDLQAAYAVGNHWAITASYFNRREKEVYGSTDSSPFDSSTVKYKRNLFEGGVGYFTPVNKQKTLTVNLYAGMAFGEFDINDKGILAGTEKYSRFHNAGISKWFFQPSLNFIPNPNIRMSIIFRSSYVHYGNIRTSYTESELDRFALNFINNKTVNFFEPAWNMEAGLSKLPWLKLSWTLSGISGNSVYRENSRSSNVSFGLSADFSKMGRKKP